MSPHEVALYGVLYERRRAPVTPTIEELCQLLGTRSKSSLHQRLTSLERFGYITIEKRGPGRRNTIRLTDKRPPGFEEAGTLMWCIETVHNKEPGVRVFQPLTLCFFTPTASERPLWHQLLADPAREAKIKRVRVTIEEVSGHE